VCFGDENRNPTTSEFMQKGWRIRGRDTCRASIVDFLYDMQCERDTSLLYSDTSNTSADKIPRTDKPPQFLTEKMGVSGIGR